MSFRQLSVRGWLVKWGLDDTERHRIDADVPSGVFGGERARHGLQPALGQEGKGRRFPCVRVVHETCADIDDLTSTLGDHLRDGPLGHVEEPGEVEPM
jgi:hypothetical protein